MVSKLKIYGKELSNFAKIVLITSILSVIIGFISLKIFTNYLSIAEYGVLSLSLSIIVFISSISSLGFESSIIRYLIQYNEKNEFDRLKNLIYTSLIVVFICSICVAACFLVVSFNITLFTHSQYFLLIALISLVNIVTALSSVFIGIIRGFQRSKLYFIFNIVNAYLGALIGIALVFDFGIVGILLGSFIGSLFAVFFFLSIVRDIYGTFSMIELKRILKFGLPQTLSSIVNTGYLFTIFYLIYFLASSEALAIFSVGKLIVTPFLMIESILAISYYPFVIKIWERGDLNVLNELVNKILNYLLIFSTAIVLGFYFLSPLIIRLFTTEEYLTANAIIVFLLIEGIFKILYTTNCFGAFIKERVDLIAFAFVISKIISVMIALFLIPSMNFVGAAIAVMLGTIIYFFLSFFVSYHFVKIEYDLSKLSRNILTFLPILLLIVLLKDLNFLLAFGITIIAYLGLVVVLKILKLEEVKEIFKLFF